jgi:hypothetical protein
MTMTRVNEAIDHITKLLSWAELYPTPQSFIEIRKYLNQELRQAIVDYAAEELAKGLVQAGLVGLKSRISSQEEIHLTNG